MRISGDSDAQLLRRMAARQRRERLVFVALAALAVIGGLNAIFGVLFSGGPRVEPDAASLRLTGHADLVGSFAEDFVERYLSATSGSERLLAKYVTASQAGLPNVAQQVSEPAVVYVERTKVAGNLEIWAATVSMRVGDSRDHRQYYRVAVSVTDGRLRALAIPAQVAPPDRAPDLSLGYQTSCTPNDQLYTVASGFLTALLTGAGDVSRYTTANAGLAALSPSPATSVATDTVAADGSSCGTAGSAAHVLATVTPHTSAGAASPLSYPLTLVRNNGQWQVSEMDPVPALSNPLAIVQDSAPSSSAGATATTTDAGADAAVPPATHN